MSDNTYIIGLAFFCGGCIFGALMIIVIALADIRKLLNRRLPPTTTE